MKREERSMLNKEPIFVLGLARGGTRLLMDLILSHPDVCKTGGEMQEIFKGKSEGEHLFTIIRKLIMYSPIMLMEGEHILSTKKLYDRKPFSSLSQILIDKALYSSKINAIDITQNHYKAPDAVYSRAERKHTRLLCKNLNGLVFATQNFVDMYPDAVFIGIVRNGFAVCEGRIRRGISLAEAANTYQKVARRMHDDEQNLKNYHVYRYEDLVANPKDTLKQIYKACRLDSAKCKYIRLVNTPTMDKDGVHRLRESGMLNDISWHAIDELDDHVQKDVNTNQISRLSEQEKADIVKIAGDALRLYGYIE